MRTILLAIIATATLSAVSAFAQPAPPASVLIIHGLPGGDLQQPAELPVDISVDGSCALTRVPYRSIIGPLSLPPGTRRIAVHYPATGTCASAPAIGPAAVPFFSGENATIIAHVGPDGRPTASKFANNFSAMPPGRARAAIHHTANAPQVDVYLTRAFGSPLQTTALTTGLTPGEQTVTPIAGDSQHFAITAAGATAAAFGPVGLNLSPNNIFSFYVVGSLTNGTLGVIVDARPPRP